MQRTLDQKLKALRDNFDDLNHNLDSLDYDQKMEKLDRIILILVNNSIRTRMQEKQAIFDESTKDKSADGSAARTLEKLFESLRKSGLDTKFIKTRLK